jgi:osmotically-inducible protein OsmY
MKARSLIFVALATGLAAGARPVSAQSSAYEDDDTPLYAPIDAPFNETDRAVDDRTVARRVENELDAALGDDADAITVRVVDGRVYLTGYVDSERTRRLIHDAVWTVAGVRGLRIDGLLASSYYKPDRY